MGLPHTNRSGAWTDQRQEKFYPSLEHPMPLRLYTGGRTPKWAAEETVGAGDGRRDSS